MYPFNFQRLDQTSFRDVWSFSFVAHLVRSVFRPPVDFELGATSVRNTSHSKLAFQATHRTTNNMRLQQCTRVLARWFKHENGIHVTWKREAEWTVKEEYKRDGRALGQDLIWNSINGTIAYASLIFTQPSPSFSHGNSTTSTMVNEDIRVAIMSSNTVTTGGACVIVTVTGCIISERSLICSKREHVLRFKHVPDCFREPADSYHILSGHI